MLDNIEVLCHSSIRISKNKVIYIDPYKIEENYNDADIIFLTHDHYDHYSEEDIDKVINKNPNESVAILKSATTYKDTKYFWENSFNLKKAAEINKY